MAERQIIIRRKLPKETRVQNSIIWDKNLSVMARFSLIAMFSLPDSWDYSVRGMAVLLGVSKDTMSKYIKELETAGYIKRTQTHGEKGTFSKSVYILTDTPGDFGNEDDLPCPKNYDTDEQCPNSSAPVTPAPVKSPQKKRTEEKKRTKQVTPKAPTGGRRSNEPKEAPDWKPERFAAFWEAYPCGKSKQAAIRAWDKLRPDDDLIRAMALGLKRAMAGEDWQRGIGIPYASTWLNGRRWEDEDKPLPARAADKPRPARPCHVELIDGEEVVVYDG